MRLRYISYFIFSFLMISFLYSKDDEYLEKKKEIKLLRSKNGISIYLGEGVAKIKNGDIELARKTAKNIATDALIKSIKVNVRSDFTSILNLNKKQIEEKIDYIIETRSEMILKNLKVEYFDFYPSKRDVTVLVYVDKADYDKYIIEEENKRIESFKEYAINGMKYLNNDQYIQALSNFARGYELKKSYFRNIPIKFEVENNTYDVEVFFENKIKEIISNIKFEITEEKFIYTISGSMMKKPYVKVYYDKNGEKLYLDYIKVLNESVKGNVNFLEKYSITNKQGIAVINVLSVSPNEAENIISLEADLSPYFVDRNSFRYPQAFMTLYKNRIVAFSIIFDSKYKYSLLIDFIKSAISKSGFDPLYLDINDENNINRQISKITEKNLDYYLLVKINSKSNKLADYEFYKTKVTSFIYLYQLPEVNVVFSQSGPSGEGFGNAQEESYYDAYERISEKFIPFISTNLVNYYQGR